MSFVIGTPHASGAGYYNNDDRPSGGKQQQADVRTCTHCQKIVLLQAWKEEGGWCSRCMAPICDFCADRMLVFGCEPFMKQVEQYSDMVAKLPRSYTQPAVREQPAPSRALILPGKEK